MILQFILLCVFFLFFFLIIDETGSFTPVLSPTVISLYSRSRKIILPTIIGIRRIKIIEREREREDFLTIIRNIYSFLPVVGPTSGPSLRVLCSSLRSRIHTKSEPACTGETSKRQSIPNPLSGECSIKTGSKLRESPISRFAIDRGEKSGARRRAAIVPATAGKRIDKGKWTWEESEAGEEVGREEGVRNRRSVPSARSHLIPLADVPSPPPPAIYFRYLLFGRLLSDRRENRSS